MAGIGVDVTIGVAFPIPDNQPYVRPGYAWAVTFAPSVSTQQAKSVSISSVPIIANASGLVPIVTTEEMVGLVVNGVVGNAQVSSLPPSITTTLSANIVAPVGTSQAIAGVPSVSATAVGDATVNSVVAGVLASVTVPTVSATGGTTSYYLQTDAVDDRLRTPVVSYTQIVMDVTLYKPLTASTFGYVFDPSNRTDGGYVRLYDTGSFVKGTGTTTSGEASNIRTTLTINISAVKTYAMNFFARFDNGANFLKADVYNIKIYNGETIVAHYDMATGTVQDQSGNGNHATLTGGTWVVV